jgi:hypothetical protein
MQDLRQGDSHQGRKCQHPQTFDCRLHDEIPLKGLRGESSLVGSRLSGTLDTGTRMIDGLFDFAPDLIDLAFLTQLVVVGQRAGRFLDPAFHFVNLATHVEVSFF